MKRVVFLFFVVLLMLPACTEEDFKTENPVITLELDNGGEIVIELFPDTAPNTTKNFVHLVQQRFYDGLNFHRVVPGFVIQGGCPLGNGTGNPGWFIRGEFSANGFDNPLEHQRGVVSMARRGDSYDSAGSQFFIVVEDAPHLDGGYAAFGRVLEGMTEVETIVNAEASNQRPLQPRNIVKATVNLNKWQPEEPEKTAIVN